MAELARSYSSNAFNRRSHSSQKRQQRGAALVVVLLLLVIVSMLGVAAMRITMMAERSARNDRDMQMAWQAAEAALLDAEMDLGGSGGNDSINIPGNRKAFLKSAEARFIDGCGSLSDGNNLAGLCDLRTSGKPAWLTVDFTDDTTNSAKTVAFGTYTGRSFVSGSSAEGLLGIRPSRAPRYVIEPIPDPMLCVDLSKPCVERVYRITSMGFGPRPDIQVVLQAIYRN